MKRWSLLLLLSSACPLWGMEGMTSAHPPQYYEPASQANPKACLAGGGTADQLRQGINCNSAAVHGAQRTTLGAPATDARTTKRRYDNLDDLFPYTNLPGWACRPAPLFNAWTAYFSASQSQGLASIDAYGDQLHELSAFAMQFDTHGNLIPASPYVTDLAAKFRTDHPKTRLLMTVTNDVGADIEKDPGVVHDHIATDDARAQHVADLLKIAENTDGLDIDYENLQSTDGANFSLFIQQLADALHAEGKYLSVTAEPKTRDSAKPMDWQAVGAAADRVRILAYNYAYQGSDPGSVSPPGAIEALINYAKTRISSDKIEIALPFHGFDWPVDGDGHSIRKGIEIDNLSVILALADKQGAVIEHDPVTKSAHFSYVEHGTDENGMPVDTPHQVWFEDAQSVFQKSELIRALGIANIGLWQLGSGDISQMFQLLQQENDTFPPPDPSLCS